MKGERILDNRSSGVLISAMYLPSIAYFQRMVKADSIFIEAFENYSRQTERNRCLICSANGPLRLSIPVLHPPRADRDIRSIRVDHRLSWQKLHWRAIESAYNRSPFFLHYRDGLEKVVFSKVDFLFDLNLILLEQSFRMLKWQVNIVLTEKFVAPPPFTSDLRIATKNSGDSNAKGGRYPQVFEETLGFIPNLSIIDLIFNRGGDALTYLRNSET